jgi:hypothetical protein
VLLLLLLHLLLHLLLLMLLLISKHGCMNRDGRHCCCMLPEDKWFEHRSQLTLLQARGRG